MAEYGFNESHGLVNIKEKGQLKRLWVNPTPNSRFYQQAFESNTYKQLVQPYKEFVLVYKVASNDGVTAYNTATVTKDYPKGTCIGLNITVGSSFTHDRRDFYISENGFGFKNNYRAYIETKHGNMTTGEDNEANVPVALYGRV